MTQQHRDRDHAATAAAAELRVPPKLITARAPSAAEQQIRPLNAPAQLPLLSTAAARAGFSIRDVADALGIKSPSQVQRWFERDNMPSGVLQRLCGQLPRLAREVATLLAGNDNEEPAPSLAHGALELADATGRVAETVRRVTSPSSPGGAEVVPAERRAIERALTNVAVAVQRTRCRAQRGGGT